MKSSLIAMYVRAIIANAGFTELEDTPVLTVL